MSPRRRHPHPEDVRTHLMDAALRVFARHGYEGASVRDIAAEAQVASGLLYHYFPSKQAVLEALFERSAGLVMEAFARAAAVPEPRARLGALVGVSARLVREHEQFWRVSYGVRFQHAVVAGLAEGIAAQSALYLRLFTALLAEIGRPEPELEARLLFAALDGVFQHYVLEPASYPLDAVIERLVHQHGGVPAKEP
ncbi:TetR/AcrR family transcriptional regulator [Sorangium cellulosum]|nr:TetR/AcrR family transcriptional regulator [Sorangium cellulosum]